MSESPVNNAGLRRHDSAIVAEDARRFLSDPSTVRVLESMREEVIRTIESTASDGSEGDQHVQLELNRMLRTLARMRQGMSIKTQLQDLRAAGFRSGEPEPEAEAETTEIGEGTHGI